MRAFWIAVVVVEHDQISIVGPMPSESEMIEVARAISNRYITLDLLSNLRENCVKLRGWLIDSGVRDKGTIKGMLGWLTKAMNDLVVKIRKTI